MGCIQRELYKSCIQIFSTKTSVAQLISKQDAQTNVHDTDDGQ